MYNYIVCTSNDCQIPSVDSTSHFSSMILLLCKTSDDESDKIEETNHYDDVKYTSKPSHPIHILDDIRKNVSLEKS